MDPDACVFLGNDMPMLLLGLWCRQHEQHERQAGRLAVRHNPIGLDRYHRRYWWGLAGERGVLFVEEGNDGEDASWSVAQLTSPPQLDALLTALDRDGIREAALAQNLEDVRALKPYFDLLIS